VNIILIASHEPLAPVDIGREDGRLIDGTELLEYLGDAQVLTDDFAPVDQLTR